MCPTCLTAPVAPGITQCSGCREAFVAQAIKGRQKRKRARWREQRLEDARVKEAEYRRQRRARLRGLPVEAYSREDVWDRTGGLCGICGGPIDGAWQVDHIVPISWGDCPGDVLANTQPSHPACNNSKGDRSNASILHAPAYAPACPDAMPTKTRPDLTRPDPFYLSPLRVNTLLLLPQLQKAVHRLWKSAIEGSGMEVDRPAPADPAACELPGRETSETTETGSAA